MNFSDQFNAFHDMASAATELDDFGPDNYIEPMRLLLSDMDTYSSFNELGAQSVNAEVVGRLIGRLKVQHGLNSFPGVIGNTIKKPVFIIGMGRTGTTVLHRRLSQNPSLQSLPFWLGNLPQPRTPREKWEKNPDYQQVHQMLEQFDIEHPGFRQVHPINADIADECRWLVDQTFWSTTFAGAMNVPNYADWVLNSDTRHVFDYYSNALKLVANGDPRRWVLKDPAHMLTIETIFEFFPDACIVQTHREPVESMTSLTSLVGYMRCSREPNLTLLQLGTAVNEFWGKAAANLEKVRQQHSEKQFFDVHIHEIKTNPMDVIERIHHYFDLPITKQSRTDWNTEITKNPSGGHGKHNYSAEQYGLTTDNVHANMGDYVQRYQQIEAKLKA